MMQDVQDFLAFEITDISGAGEVRRSAVSLAQKLGFDEDDCSDLAIIAAELARNISLHAKAGKVLLRVLIAGDVRGVELLAIDKGPGMQDVSRCMRDGYSTAGTSGTGLGAISRLSSTFDIFSRPNEGTVILSRLWPRAVKARHLTDKGLEFGVIQIPKHGETLCGDSHAIAHDGPCTVAILADGLGHGPLAHQASAEAIRLFHAHRDSDMLHIMQTLHGGLRATRGAAVSLLECDMNTHRVRFVGVGNVAGYIVGDSTRTLACGNGTVGHAMRKPTEFVYDWPANGLFIMHSDGLMTSWRLDAYPGLRERHCSTIAGVLYRDFDRGRDDVTVLVARPSRKEQPLA